MIQLTKQEQTVLCVVIALLLIGWTVKAFRVAHSGAPVVTVDQTKP